MNDILRRRNSEEIEVCVRVMLSMIPREEGGLLFLRIPLHHPNGFNFFLSIQGSPYHYCKPLNLLGKITDYTSVEIAIISSDNDCWLQPSDIGFSLIEDDGDDVHGNVPLSTVINQLVSFFMNGGSFFSDKTKMEEMN
jgi:hypothetical protein